MIPMSVVEGEREGEKKKTLKVPMIFISCLYYNKALTSFQILDVKLFFCLFSEVSLTHCVALAGLELTIKIRLASGILCVP